MRRLVVLVVLLALVLAAVDVDVRILPGHLVASCTFHQIPAALKVALQ